MEAQTNILESLLESAVDYSKTGYELVKLKALDKTSNVVSTLISHYTALILIFSFMLFISLGLAFWLGEFLGKIYYGFFIVGAFYCFAGLVFYFLLYKVFKQRVCDYVVKHMLK